MPEAAPLNTDNSGSKYTTSYYGDTGDGTSKWFMWKRTADGGIATLGLKADAAVTNPASSGSLIALAKGWLTGLGAVADAAVTNPASSGSLIALVKGLLTRLGTAAGSSGGILKTEDDVHTSGDLGIPMLGVRQDTAAALAGTTGDYTPFTTDSLGRVRVRNRYDEADVSTTRTTALAASLIVKASSGKLYGFQGYTTTVGFVQLHNTTTVPADGAVPIEVIAVEANKSFSLDFGLRGLPCSSGITLVHSATGPTKTISGSVMWVSGQFE